MSPLDDKPLLLPIEVQPGRLPQRMTVASINVQLQYNKLHCYPASNKHSHERSHEMVFSNQSIHGCMLCLTWTTGEGWLRDASNPARCAITLLFSRQAHMARGTTLFKASFVSERLFHCTECSGDSWHHKKISASDEAGCNCVGPDKEPVLQWRHRKLLASFGCDRLLIGAKMPSHMLILHA